MVYNKIRKGISLIEIILALAIIGMLIQVTYSIYFVGSKSFATGRDMGFVQQEIRNLSMIMNNELRAAKSVSLITLNEKEIIIEKQEVNGINSAYILINNNKFGPYYDTNFQVDTMDGILNIHIKSIDYPIVEETIKIRFENWESFIDKIQFIDDEDMPKDFTSLYYEKYD